MTTKWIELNAPQAVAEAQADGMYIQVNRYDYEGWVSWAAEDLQKGYSYRGRFKTTRRELAKAKDKELKWVDKANELLRELATERALSFRNQVAELEKQCDELAKELATLDQCRFVLERMELAFTPLAKDATLANLIDEARAAIARVKEQGK